MGILNGISLFANVGIAEAYMKELDIDVKIANEIDEQRARFYQNVYKETHMVCGDITEERLRDKLVEEAIEKQVDFLIATPPCQGMSEAGLRLDYDPRNQLITYAIDIIKRINPKFVLLENVPKQLTTKIMYEDELILIPDFVKKELSSRYNINTNTLVMAKDHGVPQLRARNIFLLVRNDLPYVWEFPDKKKEITLFEAIGHLPSLDPYLREGIEFTLQKFPKFKEKQKIYKLKKK